MTAMRLKRYPSPSGGIALGKMGVGATMLGSILPAGARWVEYLGSTGTQWIDTGVLGNTTPGTTVEVDFLLPDGPVQFVFGSRISTDGRFGVAFTKQSVPPRAPYSMGYRTDHVFGVWTGARQHCVFSVSPSSKTCSVDNASTTASDALLDTNLTMYLFGRNYNGEAGQLMVGKIYCCSITQGSLPVRSFAPIAIGTTGYMLDIVSGEYLPYGNKGTGDFVIGPDTNAPAI